MPDEREESDIGIRSARTVREVERTAVAAGRAFTDVPESAFRRRIVDAPALAVENTLCGFDGEDLVTSLQLYDRRCWLADVPVPVAGIGNVQTAPDHRGEGHASTLLDHAKAFAVEKGYAIVALVGNPSFYSRLGWVPLAAASTIVADPEQVTSPSSGADSGDPGTPSNQWRPFEIERDLDAVVTIHRAERRGIDGAFNRHPALWREWVFEVLADPADVHCYYEGGKNGETDGDDERERNDDPTGYLVHERDGDSVACVEVGYRGPDRESFLIAAWNLLVELTADENRQETGATNSNTAADPSRMRWDPPLETLGKPLCAAGHDLRSEPMHERTGETPMLWAASDLLDAATGGAFDSAEAVAERVAGSDRWFPALDKF